MSYTAVVKDQEELNRLISAKATLDALSYIFESVERCINDIRDNLLSEDTYCWNSVDMILSTISESNKLLEDALSDIGEKIDRFWDE